MRYIAFIFSFFFVQSARAGFDFSPVGDFISLSEESGKTITFPEKGEPTLSLSGTLKEEGSLFAIDGIIVTEGNRPFEHKLILKGEDGIHRWAVVHKTGEKTNFVLKHRWVRQRPGRIRVNDGGVISEYKPSLRGTYPTKEWIALSWGIQQATAHTNATLTPAPHTISGTLSPMILAINGIIVYKDSKSYQRIKLNGNWIEGSQERTEGRFFIKSMEDVAGLELMIEEGVFRSVPRIEMPRLEISAATQKRLTLRAEGGIKSIQFDGKPVPLKNGSLTIDTPEIAQWRAKLHFFEVKGRPPHPDRIYELTLRPPRPPDPVVETAPEPSPVPSPTPEPTVELIPSPTPEPSPDLSPSPTPSPTPEPSPSPDPTSTPEPSPIALEKTEPNGRLGFGLSGRNYSTPSFPFLQTISLGISGEYGRPIYKNWRARIGGAGEVLPIRTWGAGTTSRFVELELGVHSDLYKKEGFRLAGDLNYNFQTFLTSDRTYGFRDLLGPKIRFLGTLDLANAKEVEFGLGLTVHNSNSSKIDLKNRSYLLSCVYRIHGKRFLFSSLGVGAIFKMSQLTLSDVSVSAKILSLFLEVGF